MSLNQDHPLKKCFSWPNTFKIEVKINPAIEMLELTNFGHMTTSKIQFKPRDKTIGDVIDIDHNVITFFSK